MVITFHNGDLDNHFTKITQNAKKFLFANKFPQFLNAGEEAEVEGIGINTNL